MVQSVEMVRSIGADNVIDYKKENAVDNDKQYDAVIDVAATLSVKEYHRALKPNGICVVIGFSTAGHLLSYSLARKRAGKEITLCTANNKISSELLEINKLVEAERLRVVIDSRYALDETAEALSRAITGHPRGKIVIKVS